ncbi:sensor histidine kinase [Streptacidiphilus sp. EB129]|uniref:sensor histidine kinase n=1 Tax=Streptacidiphilus sp. EB129 TaxID=3156262 RepID=UPI0035195852
MVRAGSPPERRPAPVLAWLLPTVVTAGAAVAAASFAAAAARAEVIWCGVAATVMVAAVAVEAARRGRALSTLRERHAQAEAELRHRLAEQEAQTVRLAEVLLPQAVARLQQGDFVEDVLRDAAADTGAVTPEFHAARLSVLRWVLQAVEAEEGLRESAQRAFVNIARRVQAIVHRQAQELREMEDWHGHDPAVFDDLLRVDHGNALVGRLADSIAVLGGARPGRQWSNPVPLYSVLRGSMSRILDYQRVELHPVSEVAVVGLAVEPLIHALAELLDNATRYSPPQTRVHLTAVEVQTGIAIEIEDGGLSLSEEGRARAERMLKEAQAGIDLNDLGETPRLGLAVVGRLAQAYGFQVSLRPSAYGGVRAVLIVPQELITTAPATGKAHGIGASSGPRPTAPADTTGTTPAARRPVNGPQPIAAGEDEAPVVTERTPIGLPQRRRRSPAPAAATATAALRAEHDSGPANDHRDASGHGTSEAVQPGLWLAAFQSAVSGDSRESRPSAPAGHSNSDDTSGMREQQP